MKYDKELHRVTKEEALHSHEGFSPSRMLAFLDEIERLNRIYNDAKLTIAELAEQAEQDEKTIERLQAESAWIPCSARLPETDGRYAILVEVLGTLLLTVAIYYSAQKCFRYIPFGDVANAVYWIDTPELPQPPLSDIEVK